MTQYHGALMQSKLAQQVIGAFMLVLCAAYVGMAWDDAIEHGAHGNPKANAFAAGMAVAGLGMVVFPIDWEQFRGEHGEARLTKFAQMSGAWKFLFVAGLAIGMANGVALSRYQNARAEREETERREGAPLSLSPAPTWTLSDEIFVHAFTALLVGGVVLLLLSAKWRLIARLLVFFGAEEEPQWGFWLFCISLLMISAAFLLLLMK